MTRPDQNAGTEQSIYPISESPPERTRSDATTLVRVASNESDHIEGMAAELSPGGEFTAQTIISGRVATLYGDPRIQKIMRKLASLTKKHFTRVNVYWLGPDALEKLRAGARLTLNIYASADFNLRE